MVRLIILLTYSYMECLGIYSGIGYDDNYLFDAYQPTIGPDYLMLSALVCQVYKVGCFNKLWVNTI